MKLQFLRISMITILGIFIVTDNVVANNISNIDQRRNTTYTSQRDLQKPIHKPVPRPTPQRKPSPNRRPTPPRRVSARSVYYQKHTPTVKVVRTMPPSHYVVKNRGMNIYIDNGRYYRRDIDKYVSMVPPIGLRVRVLPRGNRLIRFAGRIYYYYLGTYYARMGSGYEIVRAPHNIIVSYLPPEADLVTIHGKRQYLYNGYIYSAVNTSHGRAFKVVGEIDMHY